MPSFKQHAILGVASGVGVYLIEYAKKKSRDPDTVFDITKLLLHASLGFSASIIPDILEPATNPNHRNFFHSITFLFLLFYLLNDQSKKDTLEDKTIFFINFVLGYSTHLFVDGTTPKGLPII